MQNHTPGPDTGQREKAVFRNLAIPVSAFDHIKDTQRALQASTGQAVTLNQTVAHIVHQHKQTAPKNVAQGDRDHDQAAAHRHRIPAILR